MTAYIYVWTRRFYRGMQLDAALIVASSAMIIGFGRAASTDMPLTAMFTVAMLSWYGWYVTENRGYLVLFYLTTALATLAKGPIAILLAGLIVLAFATLRRDAKLVLRTLWLPGIALFFIVALPWYIAVQRANPEFFRVFIVEHNLSRFATDLFRHKQPFWYYLPVTLLGLVPWTVFAIAAVVDAIRDWRFSVSSPPGEEDLRTFLVLWFLLPIVFFSISQSKLPGYILPSIPAGGILLADFIRRREEEGDKPSWWMISLHALLAAMVPVAALIVPFKLLTLPLPRNVIVVAAALAIITVLLLWLTLRNQGYRVLRFVTLVPLVIAFALILRGTAPLVNILQSAKPVATVLAETVLGDIPQVAVYDVPRGLEYGLEFYRDRPVFSYERNEIPAGDHIVVAAAGTKTELEYRLKGRKVTRIGGFVPQHVDFYLISGNGSADGTR
jgi:4-amino-4-deoxy-L-arabinose transferase-like glycosyltransferase